MVKSASEPTCIPSPNFPEAHTRYVARFQFDVFFLLSRFILFPGRETLVVLCWCLGVSHDGRWCVARRPLRAIIPMHSSHMLLCPFVKHSERERKTQKGDVAVVSRRLSPSHDVCSAPTPSRASLSTFGATNGRRIRCATTTSKRRRHRRGNRGTSAVPGTTSGTGSRLPPDDGCDEQRSRQRERAAR